MLHDLPVFALSVRQPWAWAIIHAGKPIENRSRFAVSKGQMARAVGRRIAIHAGKGMTRDEYESACAFMASLGVQCPPPWKIERGGIIGSVFVSGLVTPKSKCTSPWWMGGHGLVLEEPRSCPLVPAAGELGLFAWQPGDVGKVPLLARWMLPPRQSGMAAIEDAAEGQELLF